MSHFLKVFLFFLFSFHIQLGFCKSTKSTNLTCNKFISSSTALPKGSLVLGSIAATKMPLLNAGIVLGKTSDVKSSIFNEEILDEWETLKDGTEQTIANYDQGHQEIMLRCTYKSVSTHDKDNSKTTLMVPLPDKPVSCRFVKKSEQTLSANCSIK